MSDDRVHPRRVALEEGQALAAFGLFLLGGAFDHWTGNDAMTPAGIFCYALMVVVLGLIRHATPLGWRRIGRFVWDPPYNNAPARVIGRGTGAVLVAGLWLGALFYAARALLLFLAPR